MRRKKRNRKKLPWVEKYRPRNINNVVYQDDVTRTLSHSLEHNDLPHLLFYGPPGTGKTTIALAIAKQLFGPEYFYDRVLELNSSDERGINVVRTKIKNFAQSAIVRKANRTDDYPCPNYKIIILDEADSMTDASQFALRRIIEKYSKITRFILICNYVTRIIDPLASRCAKFRFKQLNTESIHTILGRIVEKEKLTVEDGVFDVIAETSEGDLRKAITLLQRSSYTAKESITKDSIISISGVVPKKTIRRFIKSLRKYDYDKLQKTVGKILCEGYSAIQIIVDITKYLVQDETIGDLEKSTIFLKLSETDSLLNNGGDEYIQLLDVGANIMMALKGK